MRHYSINDYKEKISDLLAQARAIKYALIHGAIDYEQAKIKAGKLLEAVNKAGAKISKNMEENL